MQRLIQSIVFMQFGYYIPIKVICVPGVFSQQIYHRVSRHHSRQEKIDGKNKGYGYAIPCQLAEDIYGTAARFFQFALPPSI